LQSSERTYKMIAGEEEAENPFETLGNKAVLYL
jgi:hypothetical protein